MELVINTKDGKKRVEIVVTTRKDLILEAFWVFNDLEPPTLSPPPEVNAGKVNEERENLF